MHFTKYEKNALFLILAVIVSANFIRFSIIRWPWAKNLKEIIEIEKAYPKIDLNKAGLIELDSVPFIGETLSRRIFYYRKNNGLFKRKEDLLKIKGINENNYRKIERYLIVK